MKISIITNLKDKQINQLLALYSDEFWCNTRKRADVEKMLENSHIVLGVIDSEANLIGFVRILTDFTYKATIYDLIVHPQWRNNNIGKLLMDEVINHPELRSIEHFDLNCLPEMYRFYKKWSFTTNVGELGFMRRFNKNSDKEKLKTKK